MRRFLAGAMAFVMAFSSPAMNVMGQENVTIEMIESGSGSVEKDGAYSSGGFTYELTGSSATITDYTGSATNVVVPATIDGYPVYSVGNSAFSTANMTSLVISEGIVNIGNYAFSRCTSLTSITIPSTVSKIGEGAFGGATALTNITINNNSYFKVVNNALLSADGTRLIQYACGNAATSYTVPTTVTKIDEYSFAKATKLQSIVLPPGITKIVENTFEGCYGFTTITIPEGVEDINPYAFDGCNGLTSVSLPASIKHVYALAFRNCYWLCDVYYSGTASDWANAYINDDIIEGATVHYATMGTPVLSAEISNGNVVLSWNAINNATTYKIYRADTVDGNKTLLSTQSGTSYTDTNVTDGNTYYYFAIASGSSGDSACSGPLKVSMNGETIGGEVTGVVLDKEYLTLTTKGEIGQLTATVNPTNASNQAVTWQSSNEAVATVSSTGLVTAVSTGSALITVKTVDGNYTATCIVVVSISSAVAVTGVSLNKNSITFTEAGQYEQLVATVSPADATNKTVIWTSTDEYIAMVDDEGYVTAMGNGTATITATTADGSYKATCQVNVEIEEIIAVSGVFINKSKVTFSEKGATQQLTLTILPSNATNQAVTWTSSNPAVATVSNTGLITAVGSGTATITVTTKDGGYSKTCAVTVNIPAEISSVTLNKSELVFTSTSVNERLTATVNPDNVTDKTVTWSSSNTSVARVDSTGLVTAVGVGTATITATAADGVHKATCTVTVDTSGRVAAVTLDTTSATLTAKGATKQLTAIVTPNTALNKNVTWKSSNTSVATVSSTGLVTAVANGTTTITVTTEDGGKTATCQVTVNIPAAAVAVTSVTVSPTSATLTTKGATRQLTATVAPNNATNKSVTYTSSNSSVATVSSTGLVTAVANGTATITVTTQDGAKTATCKITVNIPVSVTGVSLNTTSTTLTAIGATKQLTATVTPADATNKSVSWSTDNSSVAVVSASGLVTAKGNGTATITAKTADGSKTATCKVTVAAAVTGVAITPTSVTFTSKGQTRQLTTTFTPVNAANQNVTWTSSDKSVATVSSSGLVTAVSSGTATITVTTQDGGKTASVKVTVNIPVSVTGVSLNATSATLTAIGETKQLTATVAPANATNKTVTWSSDNTSVAVVGASTGLVTAKGNGTATITAKTADGSYTATCKITVAVAVTSVSLNTASTTLQNVGATYQFKATVMPVTAVNQNVTWESSDTSVATVSSSGMVTAVANGTATITVRTVDGGHTATSKVTVNISSSVVSVTGVSLNETNVTLAGKGATKQLTATVVPENATNKNVTWKSSNTSVATVSSSGLVTAVANGTTTITVTTADGSKTATCKVTVNISAESIAVTGVALDYTSATLTAIGATKQLTATVSPTNATNQSVSWSTSNSSVAVVSSTGLVTAKGNGTATITAKTADGSKTATCKVTVAVAVTGVAITPTSVTLTSKGQTKQLTTTFTPLNAANQNVTWTSSDKSVATVSSSGLVTAVSSGTATITVTTQDGGKTASVKVTVNIPVSVTGVSLNATSATLTAIGATKQLTATVAPANATNKSVTWSSDNTSVAVVGASTGLVTAKGNGTATITAKTADGSYTATCKITVAVAVTSVTLNATSRTMSSVGETYQLTATVMPTTAANKNVTWESDNTSVVTVSNSGLVTAKGSGTATVTVKSAEGSKSASCNFTVKIPVKGVSLDETDITFTAAGDSMQLAATITPVSATNQNVTWSTSNSLVATVSSTGVVTAVGNGTATITVKTSDGNYTANCKVTVNAAATVSGVTLNKSSLTFDAKGQSQTLTATVKPSNAANKNVSWTSSDTNVAIVSNTGVVTALANGTTTITVKTNDGGYTATCKVTVSIPVSVTGVSLNKTSVTLTSKGATSQLTATVAPSNAANKNVKWTSSNTLVATVSDTGLVTAVANGTVDVTVTTVDGSYTATCKVTVQLPEEPSADGKVTGITLNKTSLTFTSTWATEQLVATVSPGDALNKTVTWKSSNESVATVDNSGNVTSKGEGTATITATTADGGYTATCEVTVDIIIPVGWLTIDTYYMTLESIGQTQMITATVNPDDADNKAVIWESEDPTVAIVNSEGVVTAVGKGETKVTVTTVDGGKTASCTVVVNVKSTVTGIILDATSATLTSVGATKQLKATVTPSDAPDKSVTWTSSNEAVATVSSTGLVTAVSNGTTTITVKATDGGYTATCKVTVNIPVSVTGVTLDATSATLTAKGATKQLTATVAPNNATNKNVTWKSSNTSVATVSSTGLVTAVANGTATITVTTKDGSKTATCKVTVDIPAATVSVTSVTVSPTSTTLTEAGATKQLTATVAPNNATNKNVTWKSSNTSVATVSGTGLVTAVANGTATITVTTADGAYKATCEITVNIPVVTDPVQAFVERMYTVALGRDADAAGVANWVAALRVNTHDGANIAEEFILGAEFTMRNLNDEQYVDTLYHTFFNRAADEGGKELWLAVLASGQSRGYVLSNFVNLPEFTMLCESYGIERGVMINDGSAVNPGIPQFVKRMYTIVLGREAENDGLYNNVIALVVGAETPETVAKNFFTSQEYLMKNKDNAAYVSDLYRAFMNREADQSGLNFWVSCIEVGMTRDDILTEFAKSNEFKMIAASYGLQ